MRSLNSDSASLVSKTRQASDHSLGSGGPLFLHLPPPFGWIAMSVAELSAAQQRAAELLPETHACDANVLPGTTNEPRTLLAPMQAAAALAVDESWLLRAAREGTIPHVRLGRYVRFDPAAIIGLCSIAARQRP